LEPGMLLSMQKDCPPTALQISPLSHCDALLQGVRQIPGEPTHVVPVTHASRAPPSVPPPHGWPLYATESLQAHRPLEPFGKHAKHVPGCDGLQGARQRPLKQLNPFWQGASVEQAAQLEPPADGMHTASRRLVSCAHEKLAEQVTGEQASQRPPASRPPQHARQYASEVVPMQSAQASQ
jgi:hypothetical protein